MLDKLQTIENRFNEINRLLETNAADYQKITELARERSELEPIINKSRDINLHKKSWRKPDPFLTPRMLNFAKWRRRNFTILSPA